MIKIDVADLDVVYLSYDEPKKKSSGYRLKIWYRGPLV